MKTFLVSPLGWGLGHVSRDIPIIDLLLQQNCNVIVAGDSTSLNLIKHRFNAIKTIELKSYNVRFSRHNNQLLALFWVALRLPFFNLWEHRRLKSIVEQNAVDVIISDNRYGLRSKRCKSIIITHQLRVIPPFPFRWTDILVEHLLRGWLRKFDEVWIPDFEDRPFAGMLSVTNGLKNLRYIGLLSRFAQEGEITCDFPAFQMVVIASGPEPHRNIFVECGARIATRNKLKCLIIEGKPELGCNLRLVDGVWYVGHLTDSVFSLVVTKTSYLLFRGGYSTIMDLLTLGVSGLMIPTPGQTEQEYLADYLFGRRFFRMEEQRHLVDVDINKLKLRRFGRISNEGLANFIASAIG